MFFSFIFSTLFAIAIILFLFPCVFRRKFVTSLAEVGISNRFLKFFRIVSLHRKISTASATLTKSVMKKQILAIKQMSVFAMCFGGVYRVWGIASQYIFFVRDRLKMSRIYTLRVSAQMVKFEIAWNRLTKQFIDYFVSRSFLSKKRNFTIASIIDVGLPFPTFINRIDFNFRKNTRKQFSIDRTLFTMVFRHIQLHIVGFSLGIKHCVNNALCRFYFTTHKFPAQAI